MEVIQEQLRQIQDRIKEIQDYQKSQNSLMMEHEKWINRRERELDLAEDRFAMVEESLKNHQSYIDERRPLLGEFQDMQKRLGLVESFIDSFRGGKMSVSELIAKIGLFVGMAAALYGIYKPH